MVTGSLGVEDGCVVVVCGVWMSCSLTLCRCASPQSQEARLAVVMVSVSRRRTSVLNERI